MKFIEKLWQHRRDFTGLYECENCESKLVRTRCYDDDRFHNKVMPDEKCAVCGLSSNDMNIKHEKIAPLYHEDFEI